MLNIPLHLQVEEEAKFLESNVDILMSRIEMVRERKQEVFVINTPCCPSDSVKKYWCLAPKTWNEGLGDTEKYTWWKFYFHVYPR